MYWWVIKLCETGLYIVMQMPERPNPEKRLYLVLANNQRVSLERHAYAVAYGPCSKEEADEYKKDVS